MKRNMRELIRRLASPHYYHGRSLTKLAIHNFFQIISFLKTPRPPAESLHPTFKLKNSKRGRTALVLAGGPSLDLLNTEVVVNFVDDVFVMNGFSQLEISKRISPSFYCLSDPAHFGQLNGIKEAERNQILNYAHSCIKFDKLKQIRKKYYNLILIYIIIRFRK